MSAIRPLLKNPRIRHGLSAAWLALLVLSGQPVRGDDAIPANDTELHDLALKDLSELREAFNEQEGKVRMLLILSPG